MNQTSSSDRMKSALAAAAFHALLGYAFIAGLGIDVRTKAGETLKLFSVTPPPAEPIVPAPERSKAPEGEASPPNLKSKAAPVVAPEPRVKLDVPPPVAAASRPAQGDKASTGAAPVPGPGSGAGGIGAGTGGGGRSNGTGGGAGQRARLLEGELSRADYPRAARRAGIGGRVFVRIDIGADGRVSRCTVLKSSGNIDLDETSCRLIQQRYRYAPARDAEARAVPDAMTEGHVWFTGRRRGPDRAEDEPPSY